MNRYIPTLLKSSTIRNKKPTKSYKLKFIRHEIFDIFEEPELELEIGKLEQLEEITRNNSCQFKEEDKISEDFDWDAFSKKVRLQIDLKEHYEMFGNSEIAE